MRYLALDGDDADETLEANEAQSKDKSINNPLDTTRRKIKNFSENGQPADNGQISAGLQPSQKTTSRDSSDFTAISTTQSAQKNQQKPQNVPIMAHSKNTGEIEENSSQGEAIKSGLGQIFGFIRPIEGLLRGLKTEPVQTMNFEAAEIVSRQTSANASETKVDTFLNVTKPMQYAPRIELLAEDDQAFFSICFIYRFLGLSRFGKFENHVSCCTYNLAMQ